MDANDIINALNYVLDLGDQLDNVGGGVQGLTNGEHTTRETCKIELIQFLLYLANCSTVINNGQAAVLNLVLGDDYPEIPANKFMEWSNTVDAPDPSDNATLAAFMQGDMSLSRQNGENSSSLTSLLINIYKAFGQLLIAMNENTLAQSRYDRIISQMENRAALVGYSADDDESSSEVFKIDDDVLVQYTGNDSDVVVPDGITKIGDYSFLGKDSVRTIVLPDTVTVIGRSAFRSCDSLKSINLPEGMTEIESDAFTNCDSLTSIEIPSTVDTIGGDAFLFCNHIKCIRIPSTLTDIGDDAFMYCSGLETVVVYGGRKTISILDQMKEHFPEDVKIIWEGDEQKKAKPATTSKKAPSKKGKNQFPDGVTTRKSALDIIHESNHEAAVAAKEPFYSEEANDSPEVDAGLKEPLERPLDGQDEKPSVIKTSSSSKTKKTRPVVKGDILDLNGATVIAAGQFKGNMTLRNIVIPEGVTEIGEYAFYSCMFLETVVFPKSLRKIGEMAFMSCRNLRQVELPEGVEELETHVFGATNNLTEVHLPDSLKKVNRFVFGLGGDSPYATAYLSGKLAKQLYDINGDEFDDIYARHIIIDGKPYDNVKAYLYTIGIHAKGYYAPYDPKAAAREAEEQAKEIEEEKKQYRADMEAACREGKTLQEMIEAGRIAVNEDEYSDKDAFEQAIKYLDKNATVSFAGKHFVLSGFGIYESDVIAEIEKRGGIVHSSMVKMADYLIVCLESPGAAKVKKALEWRQKGVNNLIVSDYQMWQEIFRNIVSTSSTEKDFPISEHSSDFSSPSNKNQSNTQKTSATSRTERINVIHDSENIQDGASSSKNIEVSSNLQTGSTDITDQKKTTKVNRAKATKKQKAPLSDYVIENGSIKGVNKELTQIIIPNGVISIADSAFELFEKLTEVVIPNSVKYIGKKAFYLCTNLNNIVLPDGIVTIGKEAFGGCHHLTSITIPDSVTEIGDSAFGNCGLTTFTFPKSLTMINNNLFWNCRNLTEVSIPNSITKIGDGAFHMCFNLTSVHIPDSVTTIGTSAFSSCPNLSSFSIPKTVLSIIGNPFHSCEKLSSITIAPDHPAFSLINGVLISKKDSRLIWYPYSKEDKNYTIPQGVITIGDYAFGGCLITSVTIPNSVTVIGNGAFSGCENLTEVNFPNSVTALGDSAFSYCSSLTSITIPNSVTKIGEDTFDGCKKLTTLTIPDSVTSIGIGAFSDCPCTFTVIKESFAETYCKENRLTYISITKVTENNPNPSIKESTEQAMREVEDCVKHEAEEHAIYEDDEQAKCEQSRREQEEAERRTEETRKKEKRDKIKAEIQNLTDEMNSLHGLFAGMKRKKIQRQIDELNEQLRKI